MLMISAFYLFCDLLFLSFTGFGVKTFWKHFGVAGQKFGVALSTVVAFPVITSTFCEGPG